MMRRISTLFCSCLSLVLCLSLLSTANATPQPSFLATSTSKESRDPAQAPKGVARAHLRRADKFKAVREAKAAPSKSASVTPTSPDAAMQTRAKRAPRPPLSKPMIAVSPLATDRFGLEFGVMQYSYRQYDLSSQPLGNEMTHTTLPLAIVYEAASSTRLFGFDLRIPFGSVDGDFMIGDINLRFRWRVLEQKETQSYLSIGFEVGLPSVLLNTLGGSRFEVQSRRQQAAMYRGPLQNGGGVNLFPMRYLQIGPQVAFAQKLGPVTLGAHLLGMFGVKNRFRNLYDSPGMEFALAFDVYAVYNIFGTRLLEPMIEIGGLSYLQTVDPEDEVLFDKGEYGTGLSMLFGVRSQFAKRFEATLGLQIGLPAGAHRPHKEKRGLDLGTLSRGDWSLYLRLSVLL